MWLSYTSNGLGWGIGAATGAKLAQPDRTVICSIGDGAGDVLLLGPMDAGAVRHPVLNVVWTNRNYETGPQGFSRYGGKMERAAAYAGMYLGDPDIDYVKARGKPGGEGREGQQSGRVRSGSEARHSSH
jgi:acetolactate synthase-1/2/3 large subunit